MTDPAGPRPPDRASGGTSRPAVPAAADGDGRLILLATSDGTVYVFADRELAGAQYHVCIAANLDVEVLRVSPAGWAVAEPRLQAANPPITIVDVRPGAAGFAGEPV
jgi:hypothetical protein